MTTRPSFKAEHQSMRLTCQEDRLASWQEIQKQSQQMKRNKIYYHHDHHQPDHHQHHQHQHQHPGLRRRLPKNPLPHLHNNNLVYKFRERRAVNAIVGSVNLSPAGAWRCCLALGAVLACWSQSCLQRV
ncbi:uncharacterized protein DDB_G0281497-like isoform X3 [Octodon degus]|uniref:Uncharacterized protein DDB_G0281497-like isoform X3 n=1 Tax=Octodon degus TaxID=10160 RepID=A0A6P6E150_OCTDE|nr:uncharacterized protein DDB_G0281497-like isoform X3 [Octodon degus]